MARGPKSCGPAGAASGPRRDGHRLRTPQPLVRRRRAGPPAPVRREHRGRHRPRDAQLEDRGAGARQDRLLERRLARAPRPDDSDQGISDDARSGSTRRPLPESALGPPAPDLQIRRGELDGRADDRGFASRGRTPGTEAATRRHRRAHGFGDRRRQDAAQRPRPEGRRTRRSDRGGGRPRSIPDRGSQPAEQRSQVLARGNRHQRRRPAR